MPHPLASLYLSFGNASAEMQLESGLETQSHPMKLKVRKEKCRNPRLSLGWCEEKEIVPKGDETHLRPDQILEMLHLSLDHGLASCPLSLGCCFPPHPWLHPPNLSPTQQPGSPRINQFGLLIQQKKKA